MPHTHKKTIKNNVNVSSLKIKQRRRMNRMLGGYQTTPTIENKFLANQNVNVNEKYLVSQVPDIDVKVFFPTNTSFVKSNLSYNPFYSKKSSDVVENKTIYNFDTNYILEEIEKLQSKDRNFMITSDIISKILESKPKTPDEIPIDHKKQQELHRDLCDFD
jgi:hypothetical protein